jgi:hypothetical protein
MILFSGGDGFMVTLHFSPQLLTLSSLTVSLLYGEPPPTVTGTSLTFFVNSLELTPSVSYPPISMETYDEDVEYTLDPSETLP